MEPNLQSFISSCVKNQVRGDVTEPHVDMFLYLFFLNAPTSNRQRKNSPDEETESASASQCAANKDPDRIESGKKIVLSPPLTVYAE